MPEHKPNSAHGGGETHDHNAEHGHGVTTETSQVDPASQGTVDSAERPQAGANDSTVPNTDSNGEA